MATRGYEGVTAAQLRSATIAKSAKPSKMRNVKTQIDGFTFDSKKEAARYVALKLLRDAGHIERLEVHPSFTLHACPLAYSIIEDGMAQTTPASQPQKVGTYTADFSYYDKRLLCDRVEDVKSRASKTEAYQLRKRIMAVEYGIEICEI